MSLAHNTNDSDSLELELIEDLRNGGIEELSKQFMSLRPTIRAMIASQFKGKLLSRLDASDIVQETFIRACRMLECYLESPKVNPAIWLRTLSKQIMAEMIRKQLRLKRTPNSEEFIFDNGQLSRGPGGYPRFGGNWIAANRIGKSRPSTLEQHDRNRSRNP